MTLRTRVLTTALIMIACIACDRITKSVAQEHLAFTRPIALLGGTIRLEYVENHGAFLGFGGDLPPALRFIALILVSGALIPVTLYLALRSPHVRRPQLLGLSMIAGGGTGNLIDRLFNQGGVIDFISAGIGPLRTGIFNTADFAITAGLVVLMWGIVSAPPHVAAT